MSRLHKVLDWFVYGAVIVILTCGVVSLSLRTGWSVSYAVLNGALAMVGLSGVTGRGLPRPGETKGLTEYETKLQNLRFLGAALNRAEENDLSVEEMINQTGGEMMLTMEGEHGPEFWEAVGIELTPKGKRNLEAQRKLNAEVKEETQ